MTQDKTEPLLRHCFITPSVQQSQHSVIIGFVKLQQKKPGNCIRGSKVRSHSFCNQSRHDVVVSQTVKLLNCNTKDVSVFMRRDGFRKQQLVKISLKIWILRIRKMGGEGWRSTTINLPIFPVS